MRVLRISRTFPRIDQQGMGLHCYFYTKLIDVETTIFTKKFNSPFYDIPHNSVLKEISYSDLAFRKDNENLIRLVCILLSKLWGELLFFINIFFYVFINKKEISLIHLHSVNYMFCAILLKIIFKKKIFVNFGGTDYRRISKSKALIYFINFFDVIFFVSKSIEESLLTNFPDVDLVHIGNGVDTNFFKPKLKSKDKKDFQLFAIGNIRWQKGYKYMLDALKILVKKDSRFNLIIAGDGDDKAKLINYSSKIGISKNVIFKGLISRSDIKDYLCQSSIYVMSSVSEGFPKSILEAISCGTPIVATNVGQCKDVVESNFGFIVNSKDSSELAQKILELSSNKIIYNNFRNNCLKLRSEYSWNKMSKLILHSYEKHC